MHLTESRSSGVLNASNDALRTGEEVRLLRWEQPAGWLAVVPLRYPPLPGAGFPWKRGLSHGRTPGQPARWPLEGGVPFGVAASAPVNASGTEARTEYNRRNRGWR